MISVVEELIDIGIDEVSISDTIGKASPDEVKRLLDLLKSLPVYFPDFDVSSLELVEIWRGLRPCSPDGLPYIGRPRRYDNLIVATGHGMKGISLAPVTGNLVAQLAAHEQPQIDLT